jgi:HEAT repeat protein
MSEELSFADVLRELEDAEPVRIPLLYRLSDMRPQEFDAFTASWPQWPAKRRRVVARHMADICEENYVVDFAPAFRYMLGDEEPAVRLAALDGLWDSSNLAVVDTIIALMQNDAETQVRAASAATLGHYVLMGEWGQINERVAARIVDALLAQFQREGEPTAVRRAVLESLGNAAHPSVPDLIDRSYDDGDDSMRISAVFAMGRTADRRWMPIILDELRNPDMEMRLEAVRAAGNLGFSDPVDPLVDLLYDEDLEIQMAAIAALGQIGSESAYEALQELANNPDAENLLDAIEEAMEEIEWLGGEIDLNLFEWDGDEDDDQF